MIPVLMSIRPWVWLSSGERFSVQLMNNAQPGEIVLQIGHVVCSLSVAPRLAALVEEVDDQVGAVGGVEPKQRVEGRAPERPGARGPRADGGIWPRMMRIPVSHLADGACGVEMFRPQ